MAVSSLLLLLLFVVMAQAAPLAQRPDPSDSPAFARWLVANALWGAASTVSIHLKGTPFGNIVSFSDGPAGKSSTGTPYFYLTALDPTAQDVKADNRCSFSISEASLGTCGTKDVENPTCSKITLSGKMVAVNSSDEKQFAAESLFSKHPEMPSWPKSHHFLFYKLEIQEIFLIDFFGGPKPMTLEEYYLAGPEPAAGKCLVSYVEAFLFFSRKVIIPLTQLEDSSLLQDRTSQVLRRTQSEESRD